MSFVVQVRESGVCRRLDLMRCGCRQMRQPVLVAVGEHAETPEGAHPSKPIPSVVRLQSLDDCLGVGMDAPDHGLALLVEPILGSEDGELGVVGDALGHLGSLMSEREFKGKVVQGAPEIVKAISDDGRERDGPRLDDLGPDALAAALDVRLGPHSTRIALTPDSLLRLYALQVFGGPV